MSENKQKPKPIIPLDTPVKPFGKVSMIHFHAGERTYFLTDKRGGVTLLPSEMLEMHIEQNKKI